MAKLTETKLKKVIKERCEQCQCGEKDTEICKGCSLKGKNPTMSILRYCKECHNGQGLEFCGSEETCPIYKVIGDIKAEAANRIQGKANA